MKQSVIIMLGSNTGDRKASLDSALQVLRDCIDIDAVTSDLDNPDITGNGPDYLNRLVYGHTALSATDLNEALKRIEYRLGRDRSNHATIAIDIDAVIYGETIIKPKEHGSVPFRTLLGFQKITPHIIDD